MRAAERELREEVGFAARAVAYLGTWVDTYGAPAEDGVQEHTANSAYVLTAADDSAPTLQAEEVTAAAWFPLGGESPPDLAFPGHIPAILKLAAQYVSDPSAFPEPRDRPW